MISNMPSPLIRIYLDEHLETLISAAPTGGLENVLQTAGHHVLLQASRHLGYLSDADYLVSHNSETTRRMFLPTGIFEPLQTARDFLLSDGKIIREKIERILYANSVPKI